MNDFSYEDLAKLMGSPIAAGPAESGEPGLDPMSAARDGLAAAGRSFEPALVSSARFFEELKNAMVQHMPVVVVVAAIEGLDRLKQRHGPEIEAALNEAVAKAMCNTQSLVTTTKRAKFVGLLFEDGTDAPNLYCERVNQALSSELIVDFRSKIRLRPTLKFGVASQTEPVHGALALFRSANGGLKAALSEASGPAPQQVA